MKKKNSMAPEQYVNKLYEDALEYHNGNKNAAYLMAFESIATVLKTLSPNDKSFVFFTEAKKQIETIGFQNP